MFVVCLFVCFFKLWLFYCIQRPFHMFTMDPCVSTSFQVKVEIIVLILLCGFFFVLRISVSWKSAKVFPPPLQ